MYCMLIWGVLTLCSGQTMLVTHQRYLSRPMFSFSPGSVSISVWYPSQPPWAMFGFISRLHDPASKSASMKINGGWAFPLCGDFHWIANALLPPRRSRCIFSDAPAPPKYKGKDDVLGMLTLFSKNECLRSSYVTLERYSSHTEWAYLVCLCIPHAEAIWVFALVCLDIQ